MYFLFKINQSQCELVYFSLLNFMKLITLRWRQL